jgi:hypothetical protein
MTEQFHVGDRIIWSESGNDGTGEIIDIKDRKPSGRSVFVRWDDGVATDPIPYLVFCRYAEKEM